MRRLVLAGALAIATLGTANAGPTRKVLVDSEPPGAAVYVDDVDKGVACEPTPCEIKAPVGVITLIVRLDKYEPEVTELDVPKGKRPLQQKVKLKSAIGTIKVDMPKGAFVRIDDEDMGKVPVEIAVAAGDPHHVVIVSNGKTVLDDIVEIQTGEEYVAKPKGASVPPPTDTAVIIDDDDDGGGGGGDDGSASITDKGEARPRSAYLNIGLAFDVGARHVTYTNAMGDYVRELKPAAQALAGPAVELWPGRMAGVKLLRGFSLFGRAQFSFVPQTINGNGLAGPVTSSWTSFEGSLRQRWQFSSVSIEASAGYVQDGFAFTAMLEDLNKMPITTYRSLRIGGRLGYVSGSVEPYVSAENRYVFGGGELAQRFDRSSAYGLRASAGLGLKLGSIAARIEGALLSYTWSFEAGTGAMWQATGASDTLYTGSAVIGYSY